MGLIAVAAEDDGTTTPTRPVIEPPAPPATTSTSTTATTATTSTTAMSTTGTWLHVREAFRPRLTSKKPVWSC